MAGRRDGEEEDRGAGGEGDDGSGHPAEETLRELGAEVDRLRNELGSSETSPLTEAEVEKVREAKARAAALKLEQEEALDAQRKERLRRGRRAANSRRSALRGSGWRKPRGRCW
jgi:hypothetical protein